MGKLYVTGSVYAVVALERFLAVEAGAGDCSRRVLHGDVERCFFGAEPFVRRRVHLLQFAEISASGASRMRVLHGHDVGLYFVRVFLCLGGNS